MGSVCHTVLLWEELAINVATPTNVKYVAARVAPARQRDSNTKFMGIEGSGVVDPFAGCKVVRQARGKNWSTIRFPPADQNKGILARRD